MGVVFDSIFEVFFTALSHIQFSEPDAIMLIIRMEDNDFFHAEKRSQIKPSLGIKLGEFDPGLSIAGVFFKERVESLDVLIEASFSLFMSSQLPYNL
jgi:hypothetical protein